jgi:hypothetical protein
MNLKTILIFLLIPFRLVSQPFFDILNIKYQYFPSQYFKNDSIEKTGKEINATLMVPFVQKDSSTIIAGINYKRINSNDIVNSFSLYSFGVWIGYEYKWKNKKWSTTGFFIPKISADEFSLNGKNVQYGGVVLVKYRCSENLHYHLGLYYNRELFGNYFIPLIGINWKASEKIFVYGNLPATINMEYKISSSLYSGLSYNSFTATYALHGEFKEYYLKEGDDPIGYAQLRLFLNWYVKKSFVLFFEPGVTYKRTYRLINYSNEEFNYGTSGSLSKTRNGFFLMAGMAYRIRFDK